MAMTDEECFHFDLAGFLIRPAILQPDEVDEIVDQIDRIHHAPESLPPEHRAMPGGPASLLIDHPKVIDVLHEIISPDIRMEGTFCVWRTKGQSAGGLHGDGPQQVDPIFGNGILTTSKTFRDMGFIHRSNYHQNRPRIASVIRWMN